MDIFKVDGTSVVMVTGKNLNGHILLTIVDNKTIWHT